MSRLVRFVFIGCILLLAGCRAAAIDITWLTTSEADLILITWCPICSGLGSLVSAVLAEDHSKNRWSALGRVLANLFAGAVLGLLIALYLIGMIQKQSTDLGRVLALAVLAGYQARNLWFSQQKIVKQLIIGEIEKRTLK